MSSQLTATVTRGAFWLGSANLLSKGSQILVTLALGIFLSAAELGSVTITIALLNLGLVLQSVGVFDVIARTSEEPLAFAGTVATLSLGMSCLIAVVWIAVAPEVAVALGAPGAGDLLRVAALSLPFTAYAGVQIGYLHRGLDFRRRLIPDAGSAVTGAAVTIGCAAAGLGAWSPVAGLLTTAVLAPVLGWLVGVRIPLRMAVHQVRVIIQWVAITGPGAVLGLVLLNVDYVVISRALGEAATGVYSFAYRIAFVPYVMGAVVLGGVAFPVYARLVRDRGQEALAPAFTRFVHVVAATTGGAYLALALLADRVVVIGAQWADSGPVLRVLAAYGVTLSLLLTSHHVLRASGRPGLYLSAQIFHVSVLVVGALILVRYGIVGVAWAQVGAALLSAVVVMGMLRRLGLLHVGLARVLLRPALAAGTVALAHWLAARAGWLPEASSLAGGLLVGVLVVLAYAGALVLFDRRLVRDLLVAVGRR
jgi:O-antigen/teichoic acid export membrane protein